MLRDGLKVCAYFYVCDIIPDGLKQDGSGEMMSDGGKEKWGPWMSLFSGQW